MQPQRWSKCSHVVRVLSLSSFGRCTWRQKALWTLTSPLSVQSTGRCRVWSMRSSSCWSSQPAQSRPTCWSCATRRSASGSEWLEPGGGRWTDPQGAKDSCVAVCGFVYWTVILSSFPFHSSAVKSCWETTRPSRSTTSTSWPCRCDCSASTASNTVWFGM